MKKSIYKSKGIVTYVDVDFYKKIENQRKKYMKKYGLQNLSTKAFTGILARK